MYPFSVQQKKSKSDAFAEKLIQTRNKNLRESLSDFENSEHRLEFVKSINGIDFINDSRATNPNSAWYAIESMIKPTTWITSLHSEEDFSPTLMNTIAKKAQVVVIYGMFNERIKELFDAKNVQIFFNTKMEDLVRIAFYASEKGSVVLFSPGTLTSDTEYSSYRERGNHFKSAVSQL